VVSEPKTYWEKRCWLNEQVLDQVIDVIRHNMPPHTQEHIAMIGEKWGKEINKLDNMPPLNKVSDDGS
jgi:hypothetical protein